MAENVHPQNASVTSDAPADVNDQVVDALDAIDAAAMSSAMAKAKVCFGSDIHVEANQGARLLRAVPGSGAQVAQVVGVLRQTVNSWRGGRLTPGPDARRRLRAAFGIPEHAWDQGASSPSDDTPPDSAAATPRTSTTPSADDLQRLADEVRADLDSGRLAQANALKARSLLARLLTDLDRRRTAVELACLSSEWGDTLDILLRYCGPIERLELTAYAAEICGHHDNAAAVRRMLAAWCDQHAEAVAAYRSALAVLNALKGPGT
jgi:transcriptional regulator with XRE-family HTH domain